MDKNDPFLNEGAFSDIKLIGIAKSAKSHPQWVTKHGEKEFIYQKNIPIKRLKGKNRFIQYVRCWNGYY